MPGNSVTTALVEFPPHAYSVPHRHPGSVTAYVVRGTIRSQLEGSQPQDFAEGSTWFEAPQQLHLVAENPSVVEDAALVAVFVTEHGCGPLVIPEPSEQDHATHARHGCAKGLRRDHWTRLFAAFTRSFLPLHIQTLLVQLPP